AAMSNASPTRISERLREGLTERFRQVIPGLQIDQSRYTPPDHRQHAGASIRLEGSVPDPVTALGQNLYSLEAPMVLLAELADLPTDGYADLVRERPVVVPTGWKVDPCCEAQHHRLRTRLRLALPKQWQIDRLPHFDAVQTDWLDATLANEAPAAAGNTVHWDADLTWSRGRFPSQSANERTALLNGVVAAYQEPILLQRDGDAARR
ncbi:MAG: hypothetical protein AAF184_25525, partial [Pseudomonadota bacterium]